MNESDIETRSIADALYEQLGATVNAAYLYGSVARGARNAGDLDLLLVTSSHDHARVYGTIGNIQAGKTILIHPTIINERELESNPLFRELIDSSITLWQEPTPAVALVAYQDNDSHR